MIPGKFIQAVHWSYVDAKASKKYRCKNTNLNNTNFENPVNNARNLKDISQNNEAHKTQHTETETMKLKKFDDTNIENPVNNARNLKNISQNNKADNTQHTETQTMKLK